MAIFEVTLDFRNNLFLHFLLVKIEHRVNTTSSHPISANRSRDRPHPQTNLMKVKLNDRQIWKDFEEMLAPIDTKALVRENLEDCDYKITGYWDENEYYEEIAFVGSPYAELVSSSLGITVGENDNSHWIKLKFLLKADTSVDLDKPVSDFEKIIGELTLIFDSNMESIDENWLIDVKSPFVVTKRGQDLNQKLLQA
jgi:hypothetical protein